MSTREHVSTLEIPDGISVSLEERVISVKGKLGTIKKDFTKLPAFLTIENNIVKIEPYGTRRKDFAISKTAQSIINNMIKGVQNGYKYRMKIVFAHFPITVKIKDGKVHVENFFGERKARISNIVGDSTKVAIEGDDIVITGPHLEHVSQTAANIELSTRVKNKDQRVFLDGVYVYSRE
ncbi:MAG: 50S ribosomal protein L6 [Nitrososphaeraceae archaeon]|jgi:large subunit ribosomal protein L6|nr:50S ribosomal protein L6 [Nitrososphaeraceae archaeon]MDW0134863.1 50S ribosomal protein L6 [Nitrososphaeraceae archaeon]MDW0154869.1 50S ribosomal protein L6 [Nitrososphaeraceae archaeon]RPI81648.1 MAG: 50S ribosomal protein L6 [Nitrosopumilales archaeon]